MSTSTPIQTISCAFGDIEILSETEFHISEFAQYGSPYRVPDTRDLGTIEAILTRPDWTEDEINSAVAALNEDPSERRREWRKEMASVTAEDAQ